MLLSDTAIRAAIAAGRIGLLPYDAAQVQSASVDVRLGGTFYDVAEGCCSIDPEEPVAMSRYEVCGGRVFYLEPGDFALAGTLERLTLPADIAAQISGRSSLGRLGLAVHVTAGWIDPGWDGVLTLELYNCAPQPIVLRPGMRIAQLAFWQLDQPAGRPYGAPGLGSKYQGDREPTPSRAYLDRGLEA